MELIKPHYKISKPVKSWKEIKKEAQELIRYLHFGRFKGNWNKAFALAHCQVSETPYAFFVVSQDVLAEKMFENYFIINPEIVDAPKTKDIMADPEAIKKIADQMGINPEQLKAKSIKVPNEIEYQEPCMSFPYRSPKRIKRYDYIKVRYQIPTWHGLKTIERELRGIASEIFQHEYDHTRGENIYFASETPVKWWELIGKERSKGGTSLEPAEGLGLERAKENTIDPTKLKDYGKN